MSWPVSQRSWSNSCTPMSTKMPPLSARNDAGGARRPTGSRRRDRCRRIRPRRCAGAGGAARGRSGANRRSAAGRRRLGDAAASLRLGGGGAAGFLAEDRQAGGGDAADQGEVASLGAAISTPSMPPPSSMASSVACTARPDCASSLRDAARRLGDGGDGDRFAAGQGAQMGAAHASGADQAELEDGHRSCRHRVGQIRWGGRAGRVGDARRSRIGTARCRAVRRPPR